MSFLVDIIAMVFGMPRALFPEIAHESFSGPEEGGLAFALLFAAIPAGAVIGGIFSGWVSRIDAQGKAGSGASSCGAWRWWASAWRSRRRPRAGCGVLDARRVGADAHRRRRGRHGVGGVPAEHPAGSAADEVRGRLQGIFIVVVAGGPRIADVAHGGTAAMVGTAAAAAGGGVLVVVLTAAASVAVPVFWRYRLTRPAAT